MLEKNLVAVVTPFSVSLMGESDLKRLSDRTSKLYCTAGGLGQPPKRDPLVEKEMRRQLSQRRVSLLGSFPTLRIRWSATEKNPVARIETFNGAYHFNATIN